MNSPFQFSDGRAMPFQYDGRDRLLLPESYSPSKSFTEASTVPDEIVPMLLLMCDYLLWPIPGD